MLKNETIEQIVKLQEKYPKKRSALIPALHLAQSENGYLPQEIQKEVAELFEIDPNEVNSIVTFYDMFFEKPVGKHIVHVCKNLSCMLCGADELLEKMCAHLQVKPREVTADGEFTVIPSECLGACDLAPMMLVDDRVVGPVKMDDIDKILDEAKRAPGHPCPVSLSETDHV